MTKIQPDINTGLSWIGTILQYIKDYGIINIIKSFIILFAFSVTLRICYNPEFLLEKYQEYAAQKHEIAREKRYVYDEQVRNMLPSVISKAKADRVWVIQYHNGVSDWSYGSMRFELCIDDAESIQYQYNDFHLSWLRLPFYLRKHEYFIGNLEELSHVDHIIYDRFVMNGVKYMACVLIKYKNIEAGVLGLTWEAEPELSKEEILRLLERYAGRLEEYLVPQIRI